MPRQRSPSRDKAFEIYKENNGNIDLVKIAETLNLSPGTIRGWKNKDQWDDKLNGTFQTKVKKNTERSKRKKGGQHGNKNAKGNSGGTGGPPKNKKSETHGFFSKYLPEDTFDIIQEIEQKDPLDILWENINIQYAAIIRAQRIMYVKDKEEMIKELKKQTRGDTSDTDEYEFQFSWDRQATFLQAQSRAMTTLERLIKQYDELLNKSLATEEQKARIEVLKSKVPGKDKLNIQGQLNAIAELINKPQEREPLDDE
ncbi:phage terminase small subunit [Clostridium pasteurianum]|uniref:PBSX phage terminase small subunit-like N-terminal domain-containing protein n=1 Tax=Clostridium pasteurianum BC1 TaxID=86416 RepID=R4JXT3_CLOPA|nr:phage terminase small subunit [Clostridium pasteurianum]AGK95617.1 hypothetical protein Clopa_0569 [Clostridium pasteurianum BC1]